MRETAYPLYSVLMRRGLAEITHQEIRRRLRDKGKLEIVAQEPERVLIPLFGRPERRAIAQIRGTGVFDCQSFAKDDAFPSFFDSFREITRTH